MVLTVLIHIQYNKYTYILYMIYIIILIHLQYNKYTYILYVIYIYTYNLILIHIQYNIYTYPSCKYIFIYYDINTYTI